MDDFRLVYPMAALVLLTACVLGLMLRGRIRAVREGHTPMQFYKVFQGGAEPESAARATRHVVNLFEAPTLFYAGCLAAMVVHDAGTVPLVLAWCYVAARIAHAWIHLRRNRIGQRLRAYAAGWLALLGLWGHVVFHVAAPAA